jgi:hypothetical protein
MESSQKYRELAAKLAQRLWTADSIDSCRDVERTVGHCEALADELEVLPEEAD